MWVWVCLYGRGSMIMIVSIWVWVYLYLYEYMSLSKIIWTYISEPVNFRMNSMSSLVCNCMSLHCEYALVWASNCVSIQLFEYGTVWIYNSVNIQFCYNTILWVCNWLGLILMVIRLFIGKLIADMNCPCLLAMFGYR